MVIYVFFLVTPDHLITIFLTMADGGRNLRINPFTVDEDHIATGEKWDGWLEELERETKPFSVVAKCCVVV